MLVRLSHIHISYIHYLCRRVWSMWLSGGGSKTACFVVPSQAFMSRPPMHPGMAWTVWKWRQHPKAACSSPSKAGSQNRRPLQNCSTFYMRALADSCIQQASGRSIGTTPPRCGLQTMRWRLLCRGLDMGLFQCLDREPEFLCCTRPPCPRWTRIRLYTHIHSPRTGPEYPTVRYTRFPYSALGNDHIWMLGPLTTTCL